MQYFTINTNIASTEASIMSSPQHNAQACLRVKHYFSRLHDADTSSTMSATLSLKCSFTHISPSRSTYHNIIIASKESEKTPAQFKRETLDRINPFLYHTIITVSKLQVSYW